MKDFLWKIAKLHHDETLLIVTHSYPGVQINKCLTGNYDTLLEQAGIREFDYTK